MKSKVFLVNFLFQVFLSLTYGADREIVLIESTLTRGARNYSQNGQGWVVEFVDRKSKYILTPSHVVDGSDQISFYCGKDLKIPLELLGNSPTYDLALLKVPKLDKDCILKPLISIKGEGASALLTGTTSVVTPSSGYRFANKESEDFVAGVIEYDPKRAINDPKTKKTAELTPYRSDLLSEIGIRPGMSGAALVMANDKEPLGMGTKTRINDHLSLAIPLSEIIPLVTYLTEPGDPWKKWGHKAHFEFAILEYKDSISRLRRMVVKEKQKQYMFNELCSHSTFRLSSDWQLNGGSWADGGGSWVDGGGSWADGGGFLDPKSEYSGVPTYFADTPNQRFIIWGYYKDLEPCELEGIEIEGFAHKSARILIGLYDKALGRVLKADDLNKLLPLALQMGDSFISYVEKNGIFKGENDKNFDIFCRPDLLGPHLRLVQPVRDRGQTMMVLKNKQLAFAHENHIPWYPAKEDEPWFGGSEESSIRCKELDDKRPNFMIELKHIAMSYTFYIVLAPRGASGMILFPKADSTMDEPKFIEDKFFVKDGKYWSHTVTTEHGAKIHLVLNPDSTLFEMSVLSVPPALNAEIAPQLSKFTNVPLWLLKYYAEYDKRK